MVSRIVIWDKIALKHFINAINYIAKDSPQNARKVHFDIIDKIETIPSNPEMFPPDKYKTENNGQSGLSICITLE